MKTKICLPTFFFYLAFGIALTTNVVFAGLNDENQRVLLSSLEVNKATENHDVGRVKQLIRSGAEVDLKDSDGCTPLIRASLYGYSDIVELLIKAKADVNATDERIGNSTALMCAAIQGNDHIVKLLVQAGANINAKNIVGHTALIGAIGHCRLGTAKLLYYSMEAK